MDYGVGSGAPPESLACALTAARAHPRSDLLEYIKSLGMPMENLLCSPDYQPTLDALHDVLGGPAGTFTAGWWLSLVLATRK